jgi:predicted DNA-binding protein YlxM (UPF0122 family)
LKLKVILKNNGDIMFLTASQIKKKYNISKAIVYENVKNGNIPVYDFQRKTFYIEENDFINFLNNTKKNFKKI